MLDEIQRHDTYIENVSWKIRSKRAVMVLFAANNIVETMFYCFRPFQRVFCCIAFELFVDFFVACNLHNKSIVYITIQSNTSSLGMQMLLWDFRNILYNFIFSRSPILCCIFVEPSAFLSVRIFGCIILYAILLTMAALVPKKWVKFDYSWNWHSAITLGNRLNLRQNK